jgi:hypothetical protein
MAATGIGIARDQSIFVKKETVQGTLVYPTATDYIVAADIVTLNQKEKFENSPKVYNSRDVTDVCQNMPSPGDWMIPVLLQPSGVLGTAPAEDELMEATFGKKTVNAGVSVVYSQTIEKPSYSIWVKKGHTVFYASGATVNDLKLVFDNSCYVKAEFSGQFMKMGWAGSSQLAATFTAAGTTVTVDDAKSYTVGSKIYFVNAAGTTTADNSGTGFTVTAVNTTTNVVTFTPACPTGFAIDDWIKGFLPAGTEVGAGPSAAKKGIVKIDNVDTRTRSFEITMSDNIKYLDDERTTSGFPESFVEGKRSVSGVISLYFRNTDLKYFHDARNKTYKAFKLVIGDTAGSIIEFSALRTMMEMPEIENADPTLGIKTNIMAIGTSGEDSFSVTYK